MEIATNEKSAFSSLEQDAEEYSSIIDIINEISVLLESMINFDDERKLKYYCELLEIIVRSYATLCAKSSARGLPRRPDEWFCEIFQKQLWVVVPRRFFVLRILPLLREEALYATKHNCVHADYLSRCVSLILMSKICENVRFVEDEIFELEKSFLFFSRLKDLFMIFPLSFFASRKVLFDFYVATFSDYYVFEIQRKQRFGFSMSSEKICIFVCLSLYRDLPIAKELSSLIKIDLWNIIVRNNDDNVVKYYCSDYDRTKTNDESEFEIVVAGDEGDDVEVPDDAASVEEADGDLRYAEIYLNANDEIIDVYVSDEDDEMYDRVDRENNIYVNDNANYGVIVRDDVGSVGAKVRSDNIGISEQPSLVVLSARVVFKQYGLRFPLIPRIYDFYVTVQTMFENITKHYNAAVVKDMSLAEYIDANNYKDIDFDSIFIPEM